MNNKRLCYNTNDLGASFALAVGVMIASSLVLTLIFGAGTDEMQSWQFWLMQALYTLCIGGSGALYAVITRTNLLSAAKLNVKPDIFHILWGCGATFCLIMCMTPLNNWLLQLLAKWGLSPSVNLPDDVAGLIIVACILPCFCEELVFRGTVAQSLADSGNILGSIAVSGALFALFHANAAQTIHQFVFGCFLALLVYRSGSLWTSVAVHLFNNLAVVALNFTPLGADAFWTDKANTGWIIAMFVVGIAGFAACVLGYIKTTRSKRSVNGDNARVRMGATSAVLLAIAVAVCAVLWVSSLWW